MLYQLGSWILTLGPAGLGRSNVVRLRGWRIYRLRAVARPGNFQQLWFSATDTWTYDREQIVVNRVFCPNPIMWILEPDPKMLIVIQQIEFFLITLLTFFFFSTFQDKIPKLNTHKYRAFKPAEGDLSVKIWKWPFQCIYLIYTLYI